MDRVTHSILITSLKVIKTQIEGTRALDSEIKTFSELSLALFAAESCCTGVFAVHTLRLAHQKV